MTPLIILGGLPDIAGLVGFSESSIIGWSDGESQRRYNMNQCTVPVPVSHFRFARIEFNL